MTSHWRTRIANEDTLPLTTEAFNRLLSTTNLRLDDLQGLIATSDALQEQLAVTPGLVAELKKQLPAIKGMFAEVMEQALFNIQTSLVGQTKGDDKVMHVKLPRTVGELQHRLNDAWNHMTEKHLPDYEGLSLEGKVFAEELFGCFTDELHAELAKVIGTKKARSV